jgi:hypothetical protein
LGNRPAEHPSRPTRRSWSDWGTTSDYLRIVKSFDFCIYWLLFVWSGGIWYIGFQILWWILMAIVESVSHRIWRCVSFFSCCFGICSLRHFNVTPNVYLRSLCHRFSSTYWYVIIKRPFLKFRILFSLSSVVVV